MSRALGKVLYLRNDTILKQAFSLLRISGDNPICSAEQYRFSRYPKEELAILYDLGIPVPRRLQGTGQFTASAHQGGILLSTSRQYRSKPTHGIGRYKHLIKEQEMLKPKLAREIVHSFPGECQFVVGPRREGKVEVRPINLGTDYEYGVLNVHLTAYDMALAESYAQYVHNLCNRLSIKVEESYAMPTKTMEVLRLPDQGNKMFLDSVLTTHERVIQISGLSATFAEIFLEIIQNNLPEGVRLSVKEHTEEDFKGRFKARPELEELLAKLN